MFQREISEIYPQDFIQVKLAKKESRKPQTEPFIFMRGSVFLEQKRMIRKLKSGEYRIYSRKKNAATGKRRNLGTFPSLDAAKKHEREIQYFKRH